MLNSIIDVDIIRAICKNVVLAGDLWNVKGFKTLFKKKVAELLEGDEFPKLKRLEIAKLIGRH
jgi:hypothetical protein